MNKTGSIGFFFLLAIALAVTACSSKEAAQDGGFDASADGAVDGGADTGGQPTDDPCVYTEQIIPVPKRHTPRWAFTPWISKDISDRADTYEFVKGFQDRGIPVGVVVIDSPWETNYNTFIPNPKRYPDFAGMVADLHAQEIRVVLWMTQMINESSFDVEAGGDSYEGPSPNLKQARECGWLVNDGAVYNWWKGRGSGLDFFNPNAVIWWHRQQNKLMDMGLDGWKLDFGDSYIATETVKTHAGVVPHQQYSEAYYHDFLSYGVFRRGPEDFLTMVRPYDKSYQFPGRFFARPEDAPVGWVGDNTRDWKGLADALDHKFRSARAGYVVVGSDIGGYLDRDDQNLAGPVIPFSQDVFVRWTAVGALTPFMQLHGRANITPWTVPDKPGETAAIYKYWATLHHELVPFFYSLSEEAYAGGDVIMRPVGSEQDWPGDYRYMLGDAFLAAPILDGTGKRDVALPSGSTWHDWWRPADAPITGDTVLKSYDATDQKKIPLFVRSGAVIPMHVSGSATGIGDDGYGGSLTLLVYPAAAGSAFKLHDEDGSAVSITASESAGAVEIGVSGSSRPVILHVRGETTFNSATMNGAALGKFGSVAEWSSSAEAGWVFDGAMKAARVRLGRISGPVTVNLYR